MKLVEDKILTNFKEILTEARLGNLEQKTRQQTPKLASRSDFVTTEYIGISKFGIFNFRTTSQTNPGAYWYQSLEIPDLEAKIDENLNAKLMKQLVEQTDIKIFCDCYAFLYWAFKYAAYQRDYGLEPETRAPRVNNVRLKGALCKHLLSLVDLLKTNTLYEQMAQDVGNWLKYKSGDTYSNFHKARLMGDFNKNNKQMYWKSAKEVLDNYFKNKAEEIKFLDRDNIEGSIKSEIERTAKTEPSITLDDFIKDEFNQDGIIGIAADNQVDPEYVEKYFSELGF